MESLNHFNLITLSSPLPSTTTLTSPSQFLYVQYMIYILYTVRLMQHVFDSLPLWVVGRLLPNLYYSKDSPWVPRHPHRVHFISAEIKSGGIVM